MSKALTSLAFLALFIPLAAAQDLPQAPPPNPLAGAESVFINADMATRMEIRRVLQRELPKLKYPAKMSEADVIVEIRTNLQRIKASNRQQPDVILVSSGGSGTSQPVRVRPIDQAGPKLLENGLSGVAVHGNIVLLIHHGVSSQLFPAQFAKELVKAWRDANAPDAAPQP